MTTTNYLTERQQPAIIANPIRGKKGGVRALCRGRSSYKTCYAFTDGTQAMIAMIGFSWFQTRAANAVENGCPLS